MIALKTYSKVVIFLAIALLFMSLAACTSVPESEVTMPDECKGEIVPLTVYVEHECYMWEAQ